VRYRSGQLELDTERYEFFRDGRKVDVRPKVFDALRYFLERPGRLLTKQELLDALWGGSTVEEASVAWTISHARRAIGQGTSDAAPIETVHGRGYRWRADVEVDSIEEPAPDDGDAGRPFVGRESLFGLLRARLAEAQAGRGGACLLAGDAGIGKTRCIDELAAIAREQGFAVCVGRAVPDTLAPVYFPWFQLLRSLSANAAEARALVARLSAADAGQARIEGRDAALEQLALFESVSQCLIDHSPRAPLLLVLDDLHWADAGTVELLGFVTAQLRHARVFVLCAARHAVFAIGAGRAVELLRNVERFDLGPLSVEDVAQYIRAQLRVSPTHELCEAVHRVSAGYPLFVQETLQGLLAEHGAEALAGLPAADVQPSAHTRDSLHSRFSLLAAETRATLEQASVLGERFDVGSLLRLAGVPHDALLSALDGGVRAGFLGKDGVHRFRFRHALFREVVYERLPSAQRARMHRHVALMRAAAPDAGEHKSEIAYHHYRSLALGHHAEVRAAALEAAQVAERALAFADAAQFCGFALEALALDPGATKREYAQVLQQRASAQSYGGSVRDARVTIEQLVDVASEHGFGDILVQAARWLRVSHVMGAVPDPLARRALERALELLPESELTLRLQARSLLSWLPPDAFDLARSKQLSASLVAEAHDAGSRDALAEALTARLYALSGPDDIDAVLAVSDQMLVLDGEPGGWISLEAYNARCNALLLRGDLPAADAAVAAMEQLARKRGFLEARWHCERYAAERRLLSGDFAVAQAELDRLEDQAVRKCVRGGAMLVAVDRALLALKMGGPQALATGASDGSLAKLSAALEPLTRQSALGARIGLALGKPEPGRQLLQRLSADDFASVPRNLSYLQTLCNVAVIAVALDERRAAERLLELLAPYAGFNTPHQLRLYQGPVASFLAKLAACLGREERADRYFAQALELDDRLGLRPLRAVCTAEYAHWSQRTGRAAQAAALRKDAITLSEALGMRWLSRKLESLPER
jgi:DNA-binding winged helix-turn-helix (wHTH) protein